MIKNRNISLLCMMYHVTSILLYHLIMNCVSTVISLMQHSND